MKKIYLLLLLEALIYGKCDVNANKLVSSYHSIKECKDNYIIMQDGKRFIYDDGKGKNFNQLLNHPDIEDMFKFLYPKKFIWQMPKNYDPGRIRYEPLFRAIYGNSANEVRRNLTTIRWVDGSLITITKKEGVAKALQAVANELKRYPELKKFLSPIGGSFKWRYIAGTKRLSVHSFGAAIDINVRYSAYWRWSKGKVYKNKIPAKIVQIFERHGFIWGGKWYHYDTMHFEYRPELLK